MIIFTDGQGNIPLLQNNGLNILWIIDNKSNWETCRMWINSLKGNKSTYLKN